MTTVSGLDERIQALDGLRGAAIAAVLLYHLDAPWVPGGFLGVSLFFTLSGYLITTLLLREHAETGAIHLRSFWGRRARRLLPAALAGTFLAILLGVAGGTATQLDALGGDVLAALSYVANWRFVATHTAYGAGYEDPSLLEHYWSLAIEEQFYLVFPLLVLVALRRRALGPVLVALATASVAAGVLLHDPLDTARTYFGTDARAVELLVGALLALLLHRGAIAPTPRVAATLGWAAALASLALWATVEPTDAWLHTGGFAVVALASAALVVAARTQSSLARGLAVRPLVALGAISYGLYVYHWPIVQVLTEARLHVGGVWLAIARLVPTLLLAAASHRWLELPVRRGTLGLGTRQQATAALATGMVLLGGALLAGDLAAERAVARSTPDVALGPGTGGAPATTAVPLDPPQRVLVVGDSLLHQGLPTLRDRFARVGVTVTDLGGPSEHLMFEQAVWRSELAAAIDRTDPDVVILESCCGFGSARRDETYVFEDGTEAVPDTDATWAEWRRLADELTDVARAHGAATLWVLGPPARTGGFYGPVEERIAIANGIYRTLAACRSDVGLVDWGLLAAPDGSFAEALPDAGGRLVTVRAEDGLHFTLDGQALLADLTVEATLTHWRAEGGRVPPGTPGAPADAPCAGSATTLAP